MVENHSAGPELLKHQSTYKSCWNEDPDLRGLGWSLRVCISEKLSGYGNPAVPRTTFWAARYQETMSPLRTGITTYLASWCLVLLFTKSWINECLNGWFLNPPCDCCLTCTTELKKASVPVYLPLSCHQVRPLTFATLGALLNRRGNRLSLPIKVGSQNPNTHPWAC